MIFLTFTNPTGNGPSALPVSYTHLDVYKRQTWIDEDSAVEMAVRPILNGTLNVPLAAIINVEEEIEKLSKEIKRLQQEIKRGEGMLSNPNFVNKAPEAKVNAEREKLEGYRSQYAIVEKQLEEMKKKA